MSTIVTRSGKGSPLTNTEVDANFTNLNTGKAELSGAVFTGAITTNSTIDGRDVAADGVTADAALPKSGGAMTGAITTNSTFDGVDIATRDAVLTSTTTTANAALPKAGGAMSGAITTNSTFDGRDVATDGTKLDGIEASADVTDATNVTAAGALMDSELTSIVAVKALNQGVATGDSPTFVAVTGTLATAAQTNITSVGTLSALTVTGEITANGGIALGDNDKATFGVSDDLQIYHDGSHSYVGDYGTGNLSVTGNNLYLQNTAGETYFSGISDGAVSLYHNNLAKLATTSTGIDVTGLVAADSLTVDNFTLDGTTLALSSGDMLVDVAGNITLDADDAGEIRLKDGGTQYGALKVDSSRFKIQSIISDADMLFAVNDGGSEITALSFDASAAGAATFNSTVTSTGFTTSANTRVQASSGMLFLNGPSALAFEVGAGSEKMRLTSTGLGIGTSSAVSALDVLNGGNDYSSGLLLRNGSSTSEATSLYHDNTGSTTTVLANRYGSAASAIKLVLQAASASPVTALTALGNGAVGIGTSSPARELHVAKSANGGNAEIILENSFTNAGSSTDETTQIQGRFGGYDASYILTGKEGDYTTAALRKSYLAFWTRTATTGMTEKLRIDSSGRVLVNITGASGYGMLESTDLAITGQCILARASGSVLVGTTSIPTGGASTGFSISDNGGKQMVTHGVSGTSNTYVNIYKNANGTVGGIRVSGSATSYDTSSDYRLKENVVPMTGSIDRVKALKPSRFNFIADSDTTVDGFLAHEAQEVVPEAVGGTKDAMRDEEYEVTAAVEEVRDEDDNITTEAVEAVMGTRSVPDMQGIDQAKLVPLLTAALQEAITKIESLTTRIAALEE